MHATKGHYSHCLGMVRKTLLIVFIAMSIAWFFYSGVLRSYWKWTDPKKPLTDFEYFYAAGHLWNDGLDPYDSDVYHARRVELAGERAASETHVFYPPHMVALFSAMARLPYGTAYFTALGFNLALVALTVGMMGYILSWYRPIRLPEVALLAIFLNSTFTRNNIRLTQTSLLIFVFVLGSYILGTRGREGLAGLSFVGVTLKPSYVPFYFAWHVVRRAYRLLAVFVVVAGILFLLPVALTGRPLVSTVEGWLRALSRYGQTPFNDPSPFLWSSALLLNLQPLVNRVLNAHTGLTGAVGWALILALTGIVFFLIQKTLPGQGDTLLDFSLVSALSLLAVTHHVYDTALLFPGFAYLYVHITRLPSQVDRTRWWALFIPLVLVLALPGNISIQMGNRFPFLVETYLGRLIAPVLIWGSLAVFGSLVWLKARSVTLPPSHLRPQRSDVQ